METNPINAQIIEWIRDWMAKAKDYAERPENHLAMGEQPHRIAEVCRLGTQLADWDSPVVYWYFVQEAPDGTKQRVLRIHTQEWAHDDNVEKAMISAATTRQMFATAEAKQAWFTFWQETGVPSMAFPLHDHVGFKIITGEPRRVIGKRENKASFRYPVDTYFVVPLHSTGGVAGLGKVGTGQILDARGKPVTKGVQNRGDDNSYFTKRAEAASTDTSDSSSNYVPDDNVVPMNRANRRAKQKKKR